MAKGKKKGGRRKGDDSDENDEVDEIATRQPKAATAVAAVVPAKKNLKEKRAQRQQRKQQNSDDDDDDDDEDDAIAALIGGKLKNAYGSDDDDEEDVAPARAAPPPVAAGPSKKKKGKGKNVVFAAAPLDSSEEDEEENKDATEMMEDADDGDDEEDGDAEQVAFKLADDDWGLSKKNKKEKKEKKEKKVKKEEKKEKKKDRKKEKKDDVHDEIKESETNNVDNGEDIESNDAKVEAAMQKLDIAEELSAPAQPKEGEPKKKTKFDLQMEAAMQKRKAEEAKVAQEAIYKKDKPSAGKLKELEPEPDWVEETKEPAPMNVADATDDENELMYGAPDDVVWSDKSHAMREAEKQGDGDDDGDGGDAMMYGPDGKKLSHKERKKVLKAKAAAERESAYEAAASKASQEGAQFACSQTAFNENDPQWENSLDINIPNFSISAAGKILFKDAALTIGHGRRYGLVGPNGRGKSTLLKMIASRDLKLPPRIDFLYVEQEVVADDTPAVEAVLKADERRCSLLAEERKLMTAVDAGDESEEKITRLQAVVDELVNMGADAAEAKARRILYGLGFSMEMQTKPTKMFSGGWRMRISLARALFVEPTLLALDEPTNHLDLNAVIWLDSYLQTWKKTLLVVSHDREFLNSVCQEMLHIEDLKLVSYKGNYDSFKKAEAVKFQQQVKAWEKQEKRLRELKKSGQSKAKAQEAVKKNNKRDVSTRTQKKKDQAIAAGTETAEQAQLINRPREYTVKLEFPEVNELTRPVIEVNNVHFRYSPKHPIIFDCVDFGIDMDSRITIVGPNGAGKSTLLKLLTGECSPTSGGVIRNARLRMGIYNQHFVDRLPMTKTPVEHLRDRYEDETYQSVRNRLGRYGLEGHAHEVTMRDLSGGQKARVVFVDLSLQCPHVLLLDEPTNNLDTQTIDALTDAINAFNGGVVVVTHDQRLIEECECTLWVVEKQGVTKWEAGFEDYKETILRELEEQAEKEADIRRKKVEAAATARAEKLARLATKVKTKK